MVIPTDGKSAHSVVKAADPLINTLVSCVGKGGRVDLLGCDLLLYSPNLVNTLEEVYGINFAASDERTGNVTVGGDWILESDDIDVAPIYFDPEKLKNFSGTYLGRQPSRHRKRLRRDSLRSFSPKHSGKELKSSLQST